MCIRDSNQDRGNTRVNLIAFIHVRRQFPGIGVKQAVDFLMVHPVSYTHLMNFLTEHKIEQYADLVSRIEEVNAENEKTADALKSVEKRPVSYTHLLCKRKLWSSCIEK